jgi:hypothetical protein
MIRLLHRFTSFFLDEKKHVATLVVEQLCTYEGIQFTRHASFVMWTRGSYRGYDFIPTAGYSKPHDFHQFVDYIYPWLMGDIKALSRYYTDRNLEVPSSMEVL